MQLQLYVILFYMENGPSGHIHTVCYRILKLASWCQNFLCSFHPNSMSPQKEKGAENSKPPAVLLSTGHIHPWICHTKKGPWCADVSLCFHRKLCFLVILVSVSLNAVYLSLRWQSNILFHFSEIPGGQLNIYTHALGSVVHAFSLWAEAFNRSMRAEYGSGGPPGGHGAALCPYGPPCTELHARTELLCLLFPVYYYNCWFHTLYI